MKSNFRYLGRTAELNVYTPEFITAIMNFDDRLKHSLHDVLVSDTVIGSIVFAPRVQLAIDTRGVIRGALIDAS